MSRNTKIVFTLSMLANVLFLSYVAVKAKDRFTRDTSRKTGWLHASRTTLFDSLPVTEGGTVYLGASIIQYCEWGELLGKPLVRNRGIAGDTTAGVRDRLTRIVETGPERVFIMVGLNDLFAGVPVDQMAGNYSAIVEAFSTGSPDTRVFLCSLLPVRENPGAERQVTLGIRDANAAMRELAKSTACEYVDLHPWFVDADGMLRADLTYDGVHLNGAGYQQWRDALRALEID